MTNPAAEAYFGAPVPGRSIAAMWAAHRWRIVAGILLAAAILIAVSPVIVGLGWPRGSDGVWFTVRTEIIAQRFAIGDLLPVWSALDNHGFGSPMPANYHKLYNYVAAGLYLATDSHKAASVLTLVLFLAIGGTGMIALTRRLGAPLPLAAAVGAAFILANYTTVNWLVRTALAEFAAAMVVPWLLRAMVIVHREGRWPIHTGPLLFLVYAGHAVIGYVAAFVLAFGWLWLLAWQWRTALAPRLLARVAASAGLFLLLAAPFLAAHLAFLEQVRTGTFAEAFDLAEHVRPLTSYVYDPVLWFQEPDRYGSAQLNFLPVALALGLVAAWMIRPLAGAGASGPPAARLDAATTFLAGLAALMLFMQTAWAVPVYRAVPGLAYTQFPMRLLSFLSPLVIALAAVALTAIWQSGRPRAALGLAAATAVLAIVQYGQYAGREFDWVPPQQLEAPQLTHLEFSQVGEYYPHTPEDPEAFRRRLPGWRNQVRAGPCAVAAPRAEHELWSQTLRADCTAAAEIPLPVFHTPYTRVHIAGRADAPLATRRTLDDPRLRVALPAGTHELVIVLPTLPSALRHLSGLDE
jgi:hypothetical protein